MHNVRLNGSSLDRLELLLESPGLWIGSNGILHPVDGKLVSEARSNLLSVDLILGWAVGSPTGLSRVSSRESVD